MAAPASLRAQLLRDEGCLLKPYRDQVGKLTIGVGRNLDDVGLSQTEADFLLDNDISRASAAVVAHIPWAMALDEVRRAVLINMSFNMGIGNTARGTGLLGFPKFLAACERGDWATAAAEMLSSKWATQVGVRADRLAEQMREGRWV